MAHTLLLADDSVTIQRVVELTFAGEDIRVVSVGNGQQAIDRLSDDPPDIVLADIAMPLMDGYAVASFVRNHDALRDVPVLLMVGAFDPVDEDRVQASGATGVLVKPFEPTLVISRVKQLLRMGGQPEQGSAIPEAKPLEAPAARRDAKEVPASAAAAPMPRPVPAPLASSPPEPVSRPAAEESPAAMPVAAVAPSDDDLMQDWLGDPGSGRAADLASQLFGAPAAPREVARATTEALWDRFAAPPPAAPPPPPPARSAPPTYASPPSGGGVADAFSALLAVEQGEAPIPAPPPPGLNPETITALVDEITAKVIDRLGTAAVQERATDVLTRVAERLVREEIARIREGAAPRNA
jgi:CheY-like chemotaxis protein